MAKYIDADRLIEGLKELESVIYSNQLLGQSMDRYDRGQLHAINIIKEHIDSLQQEQPAKRGYKDCNGCEYNRPIKDQIGWQFRGCFGGDYKGKPIAEIELCPLKVAQQEQPSEDLEEAITDYYGRMPDDEDKIVAARHFYELGKKSK